MPLSSDHKPNRPDEKARVCAAGGWVVHQGCWRVVGDLAVSRAFGDRHLKRYGVCAEPELTRVTIGPQDAFVVLASDGLWCVARGALRCRTGAHRPAPRRDVVKEPACGQVLYKSSGALDGAKSLCNLALRRGSGDNISVLVVDVQHFVRTEAKDLAAAGHVAGMPECSTSSRSDSRRSDL